MRQIKKSTIDTLINSALAEKAFFRATQKDVWQNLLDYEKEQAYKASKELIGFEDVLFSHNLENLIRLCTINSPLKKMNHKEIYELLKYFDIEVVEVQSNDG